MTKTKIGLGILGIERDYRGGKSDRRMKYLRPNVALATQKKIDFDQYILLYQPGQEEIRDLVISDINTINFEHKRSLEIKAISVDFGEATDPNAPYDFDRTFEKIESSIQSVDLKDNAELYINIVTGTHAMQFSMFFIVDKRWFDFPVKLIQPRPRSVDSKTKARLDDAQKLDLKIKSVSVESIPYEVKLDWPESKKLQQLINKKRNDYAELLLPAKVTKSESWGEELKQIGIIGKETDDAILFTGETGTGKSLLAKRIHEMWVVSKKPNEEDRGKSKKKDGNKFVAANCAGFDSTLIDSELFGHVRGAFTGAIKDRVGLLEEANGGTLFLDEIGEMPLSTQAKLLKVIEEKEFSPVGASETKLKTEFRLICATNRDLVKMVREGKFRLDLYARIRDWQFKIPSLKELTDDLEILIDYQLKGWNSTRKARRRSKIVFEDTARQKYLEFAKEAEWSGNHRDLMQSINRLATTASLNKYGGKNAICDKLVKEEICRLKAMWAAENTAHTELSSFSITSFINYIKETHPNIGLVDAAEIVIRKWTLENHYLNKAASANSIYAVDDNPLKNPSATFSRRGAFLRNKYPQADNII